MKDHDNVSPLARVTRPLEIASPAEAEGLTFGLLGVLIFSLSMVSTRAAAPELGGLFVGFGRGFLAAVLAGAVLLWRRSPLPEPRHWPGLLTVSIGSVLGFPILSALAMERVPASHGIVFTALLPVATALVSVARTGERPSLRFWGWGAAGASVVIAYALRGGTGLHTADLQLLAGMLLSAVAYVEGARLSRTLGGVTVLSWSLVFALPALVPGLAWVLTVAPPHGGPIAWAGLVYVSIFSMYLGFIAWYRGLAQGGIARVSQLQTVQPLLALAWSGLLLGEPLSPSLLLSAIAVIACVAMGRR